MEVFNEPVRQVFSLCFPFRRILISVPGIQDGRIYAGQFRGNFQIKDRNLFGRRLVYVTVQDGVHNAAGIFNGNAFAGAVPACVHKECFCAHFFHFLNQFFRIFGRMQFQESLAEAGGEGRRRFRDAPLRSRKFCGKTGQEIIFGLFMGQDGNRRQHPESIRRQEDHILCIRPLGRGTDGLYVMLNVFDGIGSPGIFRQALVMEIHLAIRVNGYVFHQGVAADGIIDIRFGVFIQVDDLGIAAAFQVEDAVIVPAVFVVADKQTVGIRGQGGLAGAGQAEEDSSVLAFQVRVGGAVHGSNALQGKVVVHHGEHALLHFAAVPGVQDHLFMAGNVKGDAGFRIQPQLLVVFYRSLGRFVNYEVRLKVLQFFFRRRNEHILYKVGLPCHFHNEADGHAGSLVGAAESVYHKQPFTAEMFYSQFLYSLPGFLAHTVVVVRIFIRSPPDSIFGIFIFHNVFVLGGTAGINACLYIYGAQFRKLALIETYQVFPHFFLKKEFVGRIVNDFRCAGNTVLFQIQLCHVP